MRVIAYPSVLRVAATLVAAVALVLPASTSRVAAGGPFVVRGVVRLASGEVVKGARVSVAETGDALFVGFATTGADGAFEFDVPGGTYRVTAFPPASKRGASALLASSRFGIDPSRAASIDVALAPGTIVQAAIASVDGDPLPGAKVEVFDEARETAASVFTDETGWVTFVARSGFSVLVTPAAGAGRETSRWIDFDELGIDGHGVARPIVLDRLPQPDEIAPDVYRLHKGSAASRVTIAVISEGFTDGDEPFVDKNGNGICDDEPYLDANGNGAFDAGERFVDVNANGKRDAEQFEDRNGDGVCNRSERELFLQSAIDHYRMLLGIPGFREWRDRIDVVAVFAPSAQAGSSFPTLPRPRVASTLFGSEFQSTSFIFRLDQVAAEQTARAIHADFDLLSVLTYDLFGVGRESAGALVNLFSSRRAETSVVAAHEFGHLVGKLADEYFEYDGAPPYNRDEPVQVNVTRTDSLGMLKWARFVRPGTAIPTVDGAPGVGAFEGGLYRRRGIARPSYNCLMRKGTIFCDVCSDAMMARLGALAGLVEPPAPEIFDAPKGVVSGRVPIAVRAPDRATIAETRLVVDGARHGASARVAPYAVLFDADEVGAGQHSIVVEVVRVDGRVERSRVETIRTAPRERSRPRAGNVRLKGGSLVLTAPEEVVVPGAVVFAGADRFPLEMAADGSVRAVKAARGTVTGSKLGKAVKRLDGAPLRIVNPDGGTLEVEPF